MGKKNFLLKYNHLKASFPNEDVTIHRDVKYSVKAGDAVVHFSTESQFHESSPEDIAMSLRQAQK